MAIYRVDFFKSPNPKFVMVEANSKEEAINKAIEEDNWQKYPVFFPTFEYITTLQNRKPKQVSPIWVSVKDKLPPVDKEAVVLTTDGEICFGHIVDKKIAKDYNGWNIPDVEYWLPFVDPKDK